MVLHAVSWWQADAMTRRIRVRTAKHAISAAKSNCYE
jgi:hypothetical protein